MPWCRAGVALGGSRRLLRDLASRQLWGDVMRRWPPLAEASFPLDKLVPHEVLRQGTIFLGFLGGQWLLSYVAEPDSSSLLPLCCYRLQWWLFLPGQPLHMVRETVLFGGLSLEVQLLISVTQWPCDPDRVLVVSHCRLDVWHMTLEVVPGCWQHPLHASYLCPLAGGWPRLLCRGKLLLPMGQELLLLDLQGGAGEHKPKWGWSSIGVQQNVDLGATLLSLSMVPHPPQHATVLDVEVVANALVPQLCTDKGLVYRVLVDYEAYAAAGEEGQATLMLALLLQAFSRFRQCGGSTVTRKQRIWECADYPGVDEDIDSRESWEALLRSKEPARQKQADPPGG
ncbi:uncharacterized protein LOC144094325 isoform X2 [Amblyomma americanum]